MIAGRSAADACRRRAGLALAGAVLSMSPLVAQSDRVEAEEPNRGGSVSYEARDPAVARAHLHPADGYEIELFASEADFPIANPVALNFDARGRLWVATMPSYPQRLPDEEPNDRIVILEDRDGDGRADHHTVFLDELHLPTGFELGHGGVYVAQQPNLLFARDLDGDDRADEREVILHGFGTEDSHHSISVFTWGPGGGLYFQEGTFHHSQVETPYGPVRLVDAGVFRYKPKRHRLEVFVSYPFANPWGHVFDSWGQNFIADASGGANYFGSAISGYAEYPDKRSRMKVFTSIVRPTAGCEIVRSRHFPESAQGNFLINNTIGFQGIKQHRILEEGSGFTSEEVEPLLYSTDINFRPVDLELGPDGALYVVDWFNPLIGHMQYSLRDPRRDAGHGRIWRITYPGRPLLEPVPIAGRPIPELLDRLDTYEDRTRYRIRRELGERDRRQVAAEVAALLARLELREGPRDELEHHRLEALWVLQTVDVVDEPLLRRMLRSPEPRARAAATRVLRFWRDEVADPLALLRRQVTDELPRTRLEALLALSYFPEPAAVEIALLALDRPSDYYLDYVLGETLDALEPYWIEPLTHGPLLTRLPAAHASHLLGRLSLAQLADLSPELERHPLVQAAWLERAEADPERHRQALAALAAEHGREVAEELLRVLAEADLAESADGVTTARLSALEPLLAELGPEALAGQLDRLERLALGARHASLRRSAFTAWMRASEDIEPAYETASSHPDRLVDWLEGVRLLDDRHLQAAAYDAVAALSEPYAAARSGGLAVRRAAVTTLAALPQRRRETLDRLLGLVIDPDLRGAAIDGIATLAEEGWPEAPSPRLARLADELVDYVAGATLSERTTPRVERALALGERLALRLADVQSGRRAERLRDSLAELAVTVLELRPVPHQILFDRRELTVAAGRPVEIRFDNIDVMPHNVVITSPGALAAVGAMAERMAIASPVDAEAAGYVPESELVLFATELLYPGERGSLSFVAPREPGLYPFVCTFPGHWLIMNGVLRVVEPGDRRLLAAAAAPAPEREGVVASRSFVEDWTLDRLRPQAATLDLAERGPEARLSRERGRRLYVETGCETCHRRDSDGVEVAPDLTDLAGRYTPVETLQHILEPSASVAEAYRTYLVETDDRRSLTGLLVSEDATGVVLRPSPAEPEKVERVPRSRITSIERSNLSPMPTGLLVTLHRGEILDLLRYLLTADAPVQGGGDDGGQP